MSEAQINPADYERLNYSHWPAKCHVGNEEIPLNQPRIRNKVTKDSCCLTHLPEEVRRALGPAVSPPPPKPQEPPAQVPPPVPAKTQEGQGQPTPATDAGKKGDGPAPPAAPRPPRNSAVVRDTILLHIGDEGERGLPLNVTRRIGNTETWEDIEANVADMLSVLEIARKAAKGRSS